MVNISLITELTDKECIAQLRYIKPDGKVHMRTYNCERYEADSVHRAELKAIIIGLKEIRCSARVTIYLKTAHSVAAINQDWPKGWQKNEWKNQKGHLVRDWELWKEVQELTEKKQITLTAGTREN